MNFIGIAVALFEAFRTSLPVILAVASGLGMILTRGLGWGISEAFHALTLIFGGASLVGVKATMAEVSALLKAAAPSPSPAPTPAPAPAPGTEPSTGAK